MALSTEVKAQLDSLLKEYTSGDSPRLPGTSLSILTSETPTSSPKQAYLSSSGRRDITIPVDQDTRGEINPQTLIYIASCTKSIIVAVIFQLINEGVFPDGLEDTKVIKEHIPEILSNGVLDLKTQQISPVTRPLTLRHLLGHTSGSVYPFKDPTFGKWARDHKIPSAFAMSEDAFLTLPLLSQPGEIWAYGYGLDWAALLIKRLHNGRSVESVLKERLFDPLGMNRSSFSAEHLTRSVDDDQKAKSVYESKNGMQIHWRNPSGQLELCLDPLTQFSRPFGGVFEEGAVSFESGGAGLISTIEDYTNFLSYLLTLTQSISNPEVLDALSMPSLRLNPALVQQFFTPYLTPSQKPILASVLKEEGVSYPQSGDYTRISHTPSLAYYEEPSKQGNPAGSMFWSGITNLFYILDPASNVEVRRPSAVMLTTQILPYGDKVWKELLHRVLEVVYGKNKVEA
ncbi:unnamed protein product [Sympodiomycopsis kandeliae]